MTGYDSVVYIGKRIEVVNPNQGAEQVLFVGLIAVIENSETVPVDKSRVCFCFQIASNAKFIKFGKVNHRKGYTGLRL